MNCPTMAALAPGVDVSGKIVLATSSRYAISSALKFALVPVLLLQPVKKALPPTSVPPKRSEMYCTASLLSIKFYF